jgi:hypothetical protein
MSLIEAHYKLRGGGTIRTMQAWTCELVNESGQTITSDEVQLPREPKKNDQVRLPLIIPGESILTRTFKIVNVDHIMKNMTVHRVS